MTSNNGMNAGLPETQKQSGEMDRLKEQLCRAEEALRESEARYREMFENMLGCIAVYRAGDDGRDFIFVDFNRTAENLEKINRADIIGKSVLSVFPGVVDFGLFDVFQRVYRTGAPENHPISQYKDDRVVGWRENYVFKLPSGEIVAIYSDETEKKQKEEIITRQAQEIIDLSTPIIQIWQGILIAPLIGTLDSRRTQVFMEDFLNAIEKSKSAVAIVDITGVPVVDTLTAQHLIEAVTAAKLLGARVLLTGIRPNIAITLVQLGIDLGDVGPRSSLGEGLKDAMKLIGLEIFSVGQNEQRGKHDE